MPQELEKIRKEVLNNLIKEYSKEDIKKLEKTSWAISMYIYKKRKKK